MFVQAKRLTKVIYERAFSKRILNDLSLELHYGEMCCVMGPSGAGKTTLFNVLSGLSKADYGDLKAYKNGQEDPTSHLKYGILLHEGNLISDFKVKGNLKLHSLVHKMPSKTYKDRLELMSKRYNLTPFLEQYPDRLSFSESMWIALAKADMINPDYYFADQPTLNMNPSTKQEFLERLRGLADHTGAFVITNDIHCASYAHRVLYMSDGDIKAELLLDQSKLLIEREAEVYSWLKGQGW